MTERWTRVAILETCDAVTGAARLGKPDQTRLELPPTDLHPAQRDGREGNQ